MAAPKFIKQLLGIYTEVAASETAAAEVIVSTLPTGLLDISFMPTGIGPDVASVVASEALAAGNLVNIYNNAGVATCRKADASTTGKIAHGFVLASVLSAGMATVFLTGLNTAVTGLTPGPQFLSDTVPGAATITSASGAGHTQQKVGVATSATALQFVQGEPTTLAA